MTGPLLLSGLLVVAAGVGQAPRPAPAARPNLASLRQAKLDAAVKAYKSAAEQFRAGDKGSAEAVYRWSLRWMQAQQEMTGQPRLVLTAAEGHLARMRALQKMMSKRHEAGQVPQAEVAPATYYVAEAEVQLEVVRTQQK
jgi:hypothetical protein